MKEVAWEEKNEEEKRNHRIWIPLVIIKVGGKTRKYC
jgi:hypothetical protein